MMAAVRLSPALANSAAPARRRRRSGCRLGRNPSLRLGPGDGHGGRGLHAARPAHQLVRPAGRHRVVHRVLAGEHRGPPGVRAQEAVPRRRSRPHVHEVARPGPEDDDLVSRAQRRVAAWRPGRFPIVVFSHGLAGLPSRLPALATRWAAAGFVVVAPAYPHTSRGVAKLEVADVLNQPADASQVLTRILALDRAADDPLRGHLAPDRIAAAGHSAGAITTVGLFANGRDPRLDAGIVLAGNAIGMGNAYVGRPAALLFVHGDKDPVTPVRPGSCDLRRGAGRVAQGVPHPVRRAAHRPVREPGHGQLHRGRGDEPRTSSAGPSTATRGPRHDSPRTRARAPASTSSL